MGRHFGRGFPQSTQRAERRLVTIEVRSGAALSGIGVASLSSFASARAGVALSAESIAAPTTVSASRRGAAAIAEVAAASVTTTGGRQGAALMGEGLALLMTTSGGHAGVALLSQGAAVPTTITPGHMGAALAAISVSLRQGSQMREGSARIGMALALVNCARRSRHGMATAVGTSRRGQPTPTCCD